uniref:Uncharacterized protein n=1 Tax=Candidatus Kentrum sp. FM TaxID=2126340 RepID=A0A450U1N4_9GAMM|nr:MAG: hypothetical protein BECKFM1743C_GA0114222_109112 [Candidatus Kentron sp. FM]VFJ76273.1 MAG: hypothetical protein BECKFM1743C_GA0114222_109202 [Candidatus Kentron sp. FM]
MYLEANRKLLFQIQIIRRPDTAQCLRERQ